MAAEGNYVIRYNGQTQLYEIASTGTKPVPVDLEGSWTHKDLATKAMKAHVEKQLNARGQSK